MHFAYYEHALPLSVRVYLRVNVLIQIVLYKQNILHQFLRANVPWVDTVCGSVTHYDVRQNFAPTWTVWPSTTKEASRSSCSASLIDTWNSVKNLDILQKSSCAFINGKILAILIVLMLARVCDEIFVLTCVVISRDKLWNRVCRVNSETSFTL